jgi:hypothetical protein
MNFMMMVLRHCIGEYFKNLIENETMNVHAKMRNICSYIYD